MGTYSGVTNDKYIQLLRAKLALVEEIYKNTLAQKGAIDEKSEVVLNNLLEQRQGYITKIDKVNNMLKTLERKDLSDSEIQSIEKSIQFRLGEVIVLDHENMSEAEKFKAEIGKSIQHVKLGEKALSDGYLKNIPQTHGFFIDKKIGK
ncbi:MAG: hypothetical protein AB7G87_11355 [Clostridia bacterium]